MPTKNPPDPARDPRDEGNPHDAPEPREEKNLDEFPPEPEASVPAPELPVTDESIVDEAIDESFPASDPPSWTPSRL